MTKATFQSKSKRWRSLSDVECTSSKRAKTVGFFAERVVMVLKPLDDGGGLSTFSETLIHIQLLTNLILNDQSICLILLNLVPFYLPDQITLSNAQLFTSLENACVETFHSTSELLEVSFQILHLRWRSSMLVELSLQLFYSIVDSFLFVHLCLFQLVFYTLLGCLWPVSIVHLKL